MVVDSARARRPLSAQALRRRRRWAWPKATPCAPCRCRPRTDERRCRNSTSTASPGRRTTTPAWRTAISRPNTTRGLVANPREAALQGLAKMRALAARGFPQAVLPPHERPFSRRCARWASPAPMPRCSRAPRAKRPRCWPRARQPRRCGSPTRPPSARRRTPRTAACTSRRRISSPTSIARSRRRPPRAVLRAIFADDAQFVVHDPLPAAPQLGDEGAANHTRFAPDRGRPASNSSSTAGMASAAAWRRRDIRRGRRGGVRGHRAASWPCAGAHRFRAAESGRDRCRRVPQRRDRRRPGQRAFLPRARVHRSVRRAGGTRRRVGPAFAPIVVRERDVSSPMRSRPISSTASCWSDPTAACCSSRRPSSARTRVSTRISTRWSLAEAPSPRW